MARLHLSIPLALFAIAPLSPGHADDAACKAITEALTLMIRQPIVLQTDTRSDFPGPIETIFTADGLHASAGGQWKKIDLPGETRLAQLNQALTSAPLKDCVRVEDVDVGGVATVRLKYAQANPARPSDNIASQIWIGRDDGLPYRWESGGVTSMMKYKGVAVPK